MNNRDARTVVDQKGGGAMKNMGWKGIAAVMGLLALTAPAARAASVTLDWDANVEADLAGYRIYYAAGSLLAMTTAQAMASASVTKLTSSGAGTSIAVNNLAEGSTYYFRLTAFDSSGEESDFGTAPLEISTCVPTSPPSTPTNLSATPKTPTRIDLAWNYPGASPAGFTVEWSLNGGASWAVIASLGGSARSYQSTVLVGVPYRYRISALKPGWPASGFAVTPNVVTSAGTTPPGTPSDTPVKDRLLSPWSEDGSNDKLEFADNVVDVLVIDTAGRTVFHGESERGGIEWNGKNGGNNPLHSGLYIAKLTGRDGSIRYEKILIVK